jgi:hypothetical protein
MLNASPRHAQARFLAWAMITALVALCLPGVSAAVLPPPEQYYPDWGGPDIPPEYVRGFHPAIDLELSTPQAESDPNTGTPLELERAGVGGTCLAPRPAPDDPSRSALFLQIALWLRCQWPR